jgi:hypothetical protein
MFTVIWAVDGFHVVDLMTSQRNFKAEYLVIHVLSPMVAKVFSRGRIPRTRRLQLHLDNCRVHFQTLLSNLSLKTILDLWLTHLTVLIMHHRTSGFSVMYRLRSSARSSTSRTLDLAPSDFFLFDYVKERLKGIVFPSDEELLDAIGEVVTGIESETLTAVFEHWMERPEWVSKNNGDYYP